MMQSFSVSWADVRDILDTTIIVYETKKNPELNAERYREKNKTINWIIERMKMGAKQGGTRTLAPEYTWTFGNLYKQVARAMRLYYSQCQLCHVNPSEDVHHIRPRSLQGAEFDPRNLICLCRECHINVHRELDDAIGRAISHSICIEPPKPLKPIEEWDE